MIKAIAFDLDDTLLDTTGILVPKASADAFQILIQNELKLTLDECQILRLKMIQKMTHKEFFKILVSDHGTPKTLSALQAATDAFYKPELPVKLPLLPGAIENINFLKTKYKLYLVTAGIEATQRSKAKSLGIESNFEQIFVVNSFINQRKEDIFLEIIKKNNLLNNELLCIGNSLSSEIFDAIKIGARACYFEFGEERTAYPSDPSQQPHYHIRKHSELITTCKL
ncbi:MAG: HAD hydrolase-like protein [Pseudobdellovibrio sp.]